MVKSYRGKLKGQENYIIDLYVNKNIPTTAISKKFNCSWSIIYNLLKRNNIKIKPNGYFSKGKPTWNKGKKGLQIGWNKNIKIDREKYPNMGHFKRHNDKTKLKMRERKLGLPNLKTSETLKRLFKERKLIPWNYIDGRSRNQTWARYGDDWDKIRYLIYVRDRFMCQHCGGFGIKLHVHHKVPFLTSHDNSFDNLITLCASCHRKEEARIFKKSKYHEVKIFGN